jgi:hypothetical protein
MASQNPNTLGAIGEGGLRGLQVYEAAAAEQADIDKKNAQIAADAAFTRQLGAQPSAASDEEAPTAPAAGGARAPASRVDSLMSEYERIARMPVMTPAQAARKKEYLDTLKYRMDFEEKKAAGTRGTIGIIGTDEFGNPQRGWVSGPKVGQPLEVTTPQAPSPEGGKPVSGDEYLQTIPAQNQAYIKGIAAGEIAPPIGVKGAAIKNMVKQYDPSWNEDVWKKRQTMRRAYEPEGKVGQQMNTASTALGHAERLLDTAERLNNYNYPKINAIKNYLGKETGDSAVTDFEATRTALLGEMEKYFKGGSPAEASVRRGLEELSTNSSPKQIAAAVNAATDLMQTKTKGYIKDWEKEFGPVSESGGKLFPHDLEENDRIANSIKQRYKKMDPEGAKFYDKKERERGVAASDRKEPSAGERTVKRTGTTKDGRKVVEYSDGTIEYAK